MPTSHWCPPLDHFPPSSLSLFRALETLSTSTSKCFSTAIKPSTETKANHTHRGGLCRIHLSTLDSPLLQVQADIPRHRGSQMFFVPRYVLHVENPDVTKVTNATPSALLGVQVWDVGVCMKGQPLLGDDGEANEIRDTHDNFKGLVRAPRSILNAARVLHPPPPPLFKPRWIGQSTRRHVLLATSQRTFQVKVTRVDIGNQPNGDGREAEREE
jgi:hypothetical protein